MLHYPEKYKRTDTPHVARFLTFSCYHNLPLFIDPFLCERFLFHLDQQRRSAPFELWAYVVMPNHVHLLVYTNKEVSIRKQIGIVKRKFALEATAYLKEKKPSLASELVTFDHDREIQNCPVRDLHMESWSS